MNRIKEVPYARRSKTEVYETAEEAKMKVHRYVMHKSKPKVDLHSDTSHAKPPAHNYEAQRLSLTKRKHKNSRNALSHSNTHTLPKIRYDNGSSFCEKQGKLSVRRVQVSSLESKALPKISSLRGMLQGRTRNRSRMVLRDVATVSTAIC
eukprot:TRINITY_DN6987_c0_g1_i3.p1 TRINITY_DN6987_c0_g1~~TRINITY_DN6987_c0_g1_i3.p1  ORF type:complete len:150 (+),score=15.83 TRINITY_DN6987_c0_g1_i3:237-686(+)